MFLTINKTNIIKTMLTYNLTHKQLSQVLFILLLLFTISLTSCRKDNISTHDLIQGKWVGQIKIWKRAIMMNGNIVSEIADTTAWTMSGYNLILTFRGDSVDFYSERPNLVETYFGGLFKFDTKGLQMIYNPFSFRSSNPQYGLYQFLAPDQRDYCQMLELTRSKLVLYDRDTISRNPMIIWQQWNTFVK